MKVLAHRTRLLLLGEMSYREISPTEFARELNQPVPRVAYHFRVLRKHGYIELAWTRPVRGSHEHFYRRTAVPLFDDENWPKLPEGARQVIVSTTVEGLLGRMTQAIQAGTFTREGTHITWDPFPVDERGWAEVTEILESARTDLIAVKDRAAQRLAKAPAPSFMATVGLAGFESPTHKRDPQPGEGA